MSEWIYLGFGFLIVGLNIFWAILANREIKKAYNAGLVKSGQPEKQIPIKEDKEPKVDENIFDVMADEVKAMMGYNGLEQKGVNDEE